MAPVMYILDIKRHSVLFHYETFLLRLFFNIMIALCEIMYYVKMISRRDCDISSAAVIFK